MKALILEDNEFILSVIEAALSDFDLEILTANEPQSAILGFCKHQPDIVISDLHMVEGTSWSFLEHLSKMRHNQVLVVSSDFELLSKVEEELGLENWFYQSKNDSRWLLELKRFVAKQLQILSMNLN